MTNTRQGHNFTVEWQEFGSIVSIWKNILILSSSEDSIEVHSSEEKDMNDQINVWETSDD